MGPEMPELTEEQQAIVDHDHGPALVFAVAGAGKTTAMVHRIERLVRQSVFPARDILATSFSRASVRDIREALAPWPHCGGVQVRTLHGVGWGVMKTAQRRGLMAASELSGDDENGASEGQVLGRAVAQARRTGAEYAPELEGLDRQDFLNYVGVCKANLRYADFASVDLPIQARARAGQAKAPPGFEWYLDLYRLYEQVRRESGLLTFDDMLLGGWECLVRFPEVLAEARGRCGCVLVDEFQDVNRVQSEILDLLTVPHRSYMAIGDDDQTIYEWRGADPGFILEFERRYGARKYLISDNFRSKAAHLALANRVIERNTRREPKRLSLTQGFDGQVLTHRAESAEAQGHSVARQIKACLESGRKSAEIVVLVRLYAQTPFIEQALIAAQIPYQIVGSSPFYQRAEVQPLIDYLRLARLELDALAGMRPDRDRAAFAAQVWTRLANRPNRYLNGAIVNGVARALSAGGTPPSHVLVRAAEELAARPASALRKLAETLTWLAAGMDVLPAGDALQVLDGKLGYANALRRSSGFPETGEMRAAGVQAFLRYAHGRGRAADLLEHLDALAWEGAGKAVGDAHSAVKLMTVFRAKGLQWPVVFVPDCHQGTFPYGGPDELEEERRLFYVAITRPQTDLHLHLVSGERVSQFLVEADWERTLAAVDEVKAALGRAPEEWGTRDALALARHTPTLHLTRFFQKWWGVSPSQSIGIAARVRRLYGVAQKLGLTTRLGLDDRHRAEWERLGTADDDLGEALFDDLAQFAPPPLEPAEMAAAPAAPSPRRSGAFAVGDWVRHPVHGDGAIVAIPHSFGPPHLKVQFAKGSPVTLQAKFVSPLTPHMS
jgi:DNA helicase-2/ATP-dependent DNA helicase PcrA